MVARLVTVPVSGHDAKDSVPVDANEGACPFALPQPFATRYLAECQPRRQHDVEGLSKRDRDGPAVDVPGPRALYRGPTHLGK
jgi:hypothetical protein